MKRGKDFIEVKLRASQQGLGDEAIPHEAFVVNLVISYAHTFFCFLVIITTVQYVQQTLK